MTESIRLLYSYSTRNWNTVFCFLFSKIFCSTKIWSAPMRCSEKLLPWKFCDFQKFLTKFRNFKLSMRTLLNSWFIASSCLAHCYLINCNFFALSEPVGFNCHIKRKYQKIMFQIFILSIMSFMLELYACLKL